MENNKQQFQFKTNINCGGCVAAVKPFLDKTEGIDNWNVDTANKDKILTVQSAGIAKEAIVAVVEKAGYKIQSLS